MLKQSQALADLAWVVSSAPLYNDEAVVAAETIDVTKVDGEHLVSFLERVESYRVGRYFEALLHYWLEHVRGVRILAVGEQIRDGKITVGELDLIFDDERGRRTHWEATVKFFLHVPGHVPSEYPGPNANDNLERKAVKLFEKQLPLSMTRRPDVEIRQAFVRGVIFYHPELSAPAAPVPYLAPEHGRGIWVRRSEVMTLQSLGFETVSQFHKPCWLAPPTGPTHPIAELEGLVHGSSDGISRPQLFSLGRADDCVRCFVVHDTWPDAA